MNRERRSYPRYPVNFPVAVTLTEDVDEDQRHFSATASNISRTSIQFTCEDALVTALLQQKELPLTCELEFKLPWDKHQFALPAQVVTHRRVSQFQYVLVLLLKHEDSDQEDRLDRLLSQQQSIGLD